jgi:hypothetical protein
VVDQPALRRTHPFDHERAIDGLRNLAFTAFQVGDVRIELAAEPLLRRTTSGRAQPIRIRSSKPVTRAVISFPGAPGTEVAGELAGGGSRFFIPAQDEAVDIRIGFPELSEEVVTLAVRPVRAWKVSLVHHSHFDIGYTDMQARVITEQLAYLDDALRLAEADTTNDPSTFRWSVESIWVLREWMTRRSPKTIDRLMQQVRLGKIEIAALPFNVHTEATSTEELFGLLRYARDVAERYGLTLPVAYQTDVPGSVAGTVDALADAGVKYLSVAHNWAGRSVPYLAGGEHLPRFFRWASPAGNSVLVWVTTTAQGIAYQEGANLGFHDTVDHVDDLLPLFLLREETASYPYDGNSFGFAFGSNHFDRKPYPWDEIQIRVMGRVADNAPPNRRLSEIVAAWNERWEYPQLEITRTQDFFERVQEAHADEIETHTGDWNDWWADGLGSAARHLQLNRGAQAALAQVSSVAAMLGSDGVAGFADRVDRAWEHVELFDEHTWGAANPWEYGDTAYASGTDQWHWKAEKALSAEQDSLLLSQEVLQAFAELRGGVGDASIWVINTAGFAHGGHVTAFLPESLVHTTATIELTDSSTGLSLPFVERNQINPNHRSAGRFLEFAVASVPAVGSLRVDVGVVDERGRPAAANGTLPPAHSDAPVWHLDNARLRVEVNPRSGRVASIRNVGTGSELVNADSAFGFNAYVHDRLTPRGEFNHLSGFIADNGPDLVLLADRGTLTHVAFEDAGEDALGSWLRYRTFGVGVDAVVTTLQLAANADFLDITNRVVKPYTADKESGYFAFPFAVERPTVRYEVSGSVAGSDIPTVPGGAGYMHAIREWVTLHSSERTATLITKDAPLIQVGDIALPYAPFPGTLKSQEPGTVFSWIHNNIWDTNFPAGQSLDMEFHYRVWGSVEQNAEAAGVSSAELAQDFVRPLIAVAADPNGAPETTISMLEVGDRRIRLLGVTQTPRGTVLVKLQSLAETSVDVQLTSTNPISDAWHASMLGVRRAPIDVSNSETVMVSLPRFGTAAVELSVIP